VPTPLAEALASWPFPHLYIGTYYAGATARLRGNVAHLARDDDEAMALYEQAITDNEALGAVPWLAETRLDQAQLCLDRGDPEQAAAYARAALDDIGDLPPTRRKNHALKPGDRAVTRRAVPCRPRHPPANNPRSHAQHRRLQFDVGHQPTGSIRSRTAGSRR
jgi:tetratricopeptide (TPR) repeat protein